MTDRQEIIDVVESFYVDVIERYKDLERQIAGESRLVNVFKKVDYQDRIIELKELKKKVQNVNLRKIKIDEEDGLAVEVRDKLRNVHSLFVKVIDAQVSCQTFLLKKSEGVKASSIDYRKAVYKVRRATEELQYSLRSLDAVYADLEG